MKRIVAMMLVVLMVGTIVIGLTGCGNDIKLETYSWRFEDDENLGIDIGMPEGFYCSQSPPSDVELYWEFENKNESNKLKFYYWLSFVPESSISDKIDSALYEYVWGLVGDYSDSKIKDKIIEETTINGLPVLIIDEPGADYAWFIPRDGAVVSCFFGIMELGVDFDDEGTRAIKAITKSFKIVN